jgi:hypothetical protein
MLVVVQWSGSLPCLLRSTGTRAGACDTMEPILFQVDDIGDSSTLFSFFFNAE